MRRGGGLRQLAAPRYVAPLLLVPGDEIGVPVDAEKPVAFLRYLGTRPCDVATHRAMCTVLALGGGQAVHADPDSLLWCRLAVQP